MVEDGGGWWRGIPPPTSTNLHEPPTISANHDGSFDHDPLWLCSRIECVSPASQLDKRVVALFEHDPSVWMRALRSRQRFAEYHGQGTLGSRALTQILEVDGRSAGERSLSGTV